MLLRAAVLRHPQFAGVITVDDCHTEDRRRLGERFTSLLFEANTTAEKQWYATRLGAQARREFQDECSFPSAGNFFDEAIMFESKSLNVSDAKW